MVYYGVFLSAPSVGGNMYLNFFLTSLVELPAIPLGVWAYNKWVEALNRLIPIRQPLVTSKRPLIPTIRLPILTTNPTTRPLTVQSKRPLIPTTRLPLLTTRPPTRRHDHLHRANDYWSRIHDHQSPPIPRPHMPSKRELIPTTRTFVPSKRPRYHGNYVRSTLLAKKSHWLIQTGHDWCSRYDSTQWLLPTQL